AVPQFDYMRVVSSLIVLLLISTLGCDNVFVDAPFGDPLPDRTLESFRGTWADKQGNVYFVEVAAKSDLVVGFTKWNSKTDAFETQSVPVSIRTVQNRTFLFIPPDTHKEDRLVFVWLSDIQDGRIYGRACNPDAFREAVLSGTLGGQVVRRKNDHFNVRLEASDQLGAFLASPDGASFFDEQNDQPLRRLAFRADGEPADAREPPN
ncbi:hypothetical protein, partial [Roseiconus lacunae]